MSGGRRKMKTQLSIKSIVAIGIGSALFFVLGRFVAIPSPIPNTTINIQYAVLGVLGVLFGPIVGFLTGLIGHVLIDLSWGSPWWSWIVGSGVFGFIVGIVSKKIDMEAGVFGSKEIALFNGFQIAAHIGAWGMIAPGLDILIYSEPVVKAFTQGIAAAIMNGVSTAVIGTVLLIGYAKTKVGTGSLKKEN